MQQLRILLIASWYKDENNTTAGSFIAEQANMLKKQGHHVVVLHPYLKGTFLGTLKDRKITISQSKDENGIEIIKLGIAPVFPKWRKISYLKLNRLAINIVKQYMQQQGNFDIIHAHSLFMGGIVAKALSQKFKIPFFHTEHTSGLIFNPKQYTKSDIWLLKSTFKAAEKVFFVSRFFQTELQNRYNLELKQATVLHNMVDNLFFAPPTLPPLVKPNFKYIVIGSLIPIKQIDSLIKAFQQLLLIYPASTLTIAGDGFLKKELEQLVETLNLKDKIDFLPRLNRQEVKKAIDEHHCLVSASRLETFGLTVAEAIACGRPVVATNSGGVLDIIDTHNGIVTDNNIEDLVKGLVTIQSNYDQYQPIELQESCRQKFSAENIYAQLAKHYFGALKKQV